MDPPFRPLAISLTVWGALLGLSLVGTVFAFIVYYRIIMHYGATVLSTAAYILPLFSTIFGVVFLHEPLTLRFCLAAILILLGTMVVNGLIRLSTFGRVKD